MKPTGIVRKIDNLGRLVIPKELRNILDIDSHDGLEIYIEERSIVISKHENKCVFCEGLDSLTSFGGKLICKSCVSLIGEAG